MTDARLWIYAQSSSAGAQKITWESCTRSGPPSPYWPGAKPAGTSTGSSAALARNRAALEGMTDHLTSLGARVGVYSTGTQWRKIVGTVPPSSSLIELRSWVAGATTLDGAIDNCDDPPLTRGPVVHSQYVSDGLDHNRSCI